VLSGYQDKALIDLELGYVVRIDPINALVLSNVRVVGDTDVYRFQRLKGLLASTPSAPSLATHARTMSRTRDSA
jgi:hypothetical protein